jgi:hypothetical protein
MKAFLLSSAISIIQYFMKERILEIVHDRWKAGWPSGLNGIMQERKIEVII